MTDVARLRNGAELPELDARARIVRACVAETADRADTGIVVDLDAVPRREPGMEPFEVMISESQERMLAIVRPENRAVVEAICARWGLPCAVIGRVTTDVPLICRNCSGDEQMIAKSSQA